uniref:Putative secreted peptide n=1 Tax=Anopheles braziliensis TaxID=58242 RepID=A0A2M3ZPH2_9DIPT
MLALLLLGLPGVVLTKSPVDDHRLPIPVAPASSAWWAVEPTVAAGCLGDGDGAGEIEWLLIESECSDPFE